jgi:prepilin-type N-terminal cleavage/methylation domain-containing protein
MKRRGFSLIELLISLFILGIVIVTISTIFFYGFNSVNRTKQVAMATQIAHEEMELIRNMKFENILTMGSTFTHDLFLELDNGEGAVFVQDGPGSDIKKLTVRVSWDYRGESKLKNFVTYITRDGINKK